MATLFRLPLVRRLGCSVGGQHCIQYPVSIAGVQRQFFATSALARQSEKCKGQFFETQHTQPPGLVEIDFEVLKSMSPEAMKLLREAFVGKKAYGAIAVTNIPNYGDLRERAFRHGIDLALKDSEGRQNAAAVNNTYPGWSGVPGEETHPLQSSFLFNVKEEIPGGKPDPYFGKNIFPSEEYRQAFRSLATPMHDAALQVLRGCDLILKEDLPRWSSAGRSLERLASNGPALAGRFICYDSGFTREDTLLDEKHDEKNMNDTNLQQQNPATTISTPAKSAGHAGDGLASMRTHSTPVKSAGHAGDGLASMRTHSTPVKSAGHAGDGLASMRTHSTPVKSAGHAGDGLASMRTHSTPVKSAGHAGDGLASMRTHSTPVKSAGHAGDGLASMRTHSTPVKSAGHAGDGLASMRTHSTPVKSAGHAGDGLASMRTHSTPVKSAGHAGDGLASMRTHSTPVKTAGHAGDGLASMRTHSTPVKSAGHAGDGLASMRTHSTPVKSAGQAGESLASMRAHTNPVSAGFAHSRAQSTQVVAQSIENDVFSLPIADVGTVETLNDGAAAVEKPQTDEAGEYWLPWHIDSNFVTVLHREMYAYESDAAFAPEPEGAGLLMMNEDGDLAKVETTGDVMLLQMGAFAQIYAGGQVTACRHAVLSPQPPGIARFNYCNFWYVPWSTLCDIPEGCHDKAVNKGWNAMMDESYVNITMKESFVAFRDFMTSPEARAQFMDSVRFKELSEIFPLPARVSNEVLSNEGDKPPTEIVIDVMTDVRCPFSYLSQVNMEQALRNMGLDGHVLIRYHPVFLNPNVPKEGESLDDYLLREYDYSREYAHSEHYPLRVQGLKAGIRFNPNRRVVNTFDAFCLVTAAQDVGKQQDAVKALSTRYFEGAEDISDEAVLREIALEIGLSPSALAQVRDRVQSTYEELASRLGEVPHFLLRERVSGNGLDVTGNRSVENWEAVLGSVLEKSRFVGMQIPGPYDSKVWLAEANPNAPVSMALRSQHKWAPKEWPYSEHDFKRADETEDKSMYAEPRFVNHLDDVSLKRLSEAYRSIFKMVPQGFSALDLCSSWNSHYPQELLKGARVVVHGLNEQELKANSIASDHHVQDLNADAKLPWEVGSFDFVTLALSVQYLTNPRAVFQEIHRVLKPGGMAIVAFSHRAFFEKAAKIWADDMYDGEGHVHVVSRYFQHGPAGGWENLSSFDVSPKHADPMWLVTAVKTGGPKQ